MTTSQLPPISLYVHIPWCVRKCPYCDFNSHQTDNALPEAEYVSALIEDLHEKSHLADGRKLQSVFFGGGTPSLFSGSTIAEVIEAASRIIGLKKDAEITLEANPGTVDIGHFINYANAGVNRLSLGAQSFSDRHLQALGRIHASADIHRAIEEIHRAGISNFNIDLMHGLPDQTPDGALDDLKTAIQAQPTHISWYQLTIEPNTVFYSRPPALPDDDSLSDIQEAGHALLQQHHFDQYEVSAYSRENHPSAHNLNYWQFGDYIGIGAGAHSKVTVKTDYSTDNLQINRSANTRLPADYMHRDKPFHRGFTAVPKTRLPMEFLMNALRLRAGCPGELFNQHTGLGLDVLRDRWDSLVDRGLVEPLGDCLKTTALGYRFLN
ncbi:MAG: radical SAM family heme chaperone HemW, partial [bacterium]